MKFRCVACRRQVVGKEVMELHRVVEADSEEEARTIFQECLDTVARDVAPLAILLGFKPESGVATIVSVTEIK